MATEEELIRLVLELEGKEEVDKAVESYKEFSKSIQDGVRPLEEATRVVRELGENTTELTQADDEATRAAIAQTQAQRAANQAFEDATAAVEKARLAQEELDRVVASNQSNINLLNGDEITGFKGMATQAFKAEKAVASLASGHGLARLGPILEGALGPMGVPGLGMALGGLAYAIEPLIPKMKEFFLAFETGNTTIGKAADSLEAFNRAAAAGPSVAKRALGRIEGRLTELQDKQAEQGYLSAAESLEQLRLQRTVGVARQRVEDEERRQREFASTPEESRRREALRESAEEQKILAEDPDQQYMERHKARLARNKAEGDKRRAKDKQTREWLDHEGANEERELREMRKDQDEKAAADHKADVFTTQADAKQKRDAERLAAKQQREEATNLRHHMREQERLAREIERAGTPQAINRARRQAEEGEALGAIQQNTWGFNAAQQEAMAKRLLEQLPSVGNDFAAALARVVQWQNDKIVRDFNSAVPTTLGR